MKRVLGLDLGTTSIGWALVNQAETPCERSSIIRAGVRVNPISSDEKGEFEKGKDSTTNAGRRLKRSIRRNLQRYKLRRDSLIKALKREGWINEDTILAEHSNRSTFETYRLRAEAAERPVSLEQFARILLMINKKRGYKSNRKLKNQESGSSIDGIGIAKKLQEQGITPGQYCFALLKNGEKFLPAFYRSDLSAELDKVWAFQKKFYPDILTDEIKHSISGKARNATAAVFKEKYGISSADNKGKDRKLQSYNWRNTAVKEKLPIDVVIYVIADINGLIAEASGLLGTISDRSKELYFNNETVGQYLWKSICDNPSSSLKNITFYRQDYLDEFDKLWNIQAQFHKELTEALRKEIRDRIIFYQRRLKSQKRLISECEFEKHHKVAPKSSLMFQEFKIWQILNNVSVTDTNTGEIKPLSQEKKEELALELRFKKKISGPEALKILFRGNSKDYSLNYKALEGNSTLCAIAEKLLYIAGTKNRQEYIIYKLSGEDILNEIKRSFKSKKVLQLLSFDSTLNKEELEAQASWRLWHLIYSYEGDNSKTGDESLVKKISLLSELTEDESKIISGISFIEGYGSLSNRAIRKILPFLKAGEKYDKACELAGYNHSHSETKEEQQRKSLSDKLEAIPKNSLRNPVVEKILNQMVNVINTISDTYGKPDEIHLEMARELKMDKASRARKTESISQNENENKRIREILEKEFGFSYVRNIDIVRYKLYEELKPRGYKTLYSNQYISREQLFSKEIDIEHIIPQSVLFDDSFANKTLEFRAVNIEKGDKTAYDYISSIKNAEDIESYKSGINDLVKNGKISRAKGKYLLMRKEDIPSDFLNRDLSNTQYIARKATEILGSYVRTVIPTTGSITARLREDWQLVDVMKEMSMPKYEAAGLSFTVTDNDGRKIKKIKDWTKRNDHRHHAMDALTIAFTKPSHIQYLNNLNAKSDKSSSVYGIWQNETIKIGDKRIFIPPMPLDELRAAFRKELESVLVSIKAKNKVATPNENKTKGIIQKTLTPRGELHKETVYGKKLKYETFVLKVGSKLDADAINTVANKKEREALMGRLAEFGGDPRKAFTGKNAPDKNPIWADAVHSSKIGTEVKCVKLKEVFTIRKAIGPDLKIEKVLDAGVRAILKARLDEFGGNAAKAFSNLDENPIWLNKEAGIDIKRVVIEENIPGQALREKRDLSGKKMLDADGRAYPADYVNLRNNHHIAIYRNGNGALEENVVSFFEAMQRISGGFKAVDKDYKKDEGYKFLFSMKINEMFVFPNPETGFYPEDIDLTDKNNFTLISPNLFRVQKLSKGDYYFRHHLETNIDDTKELKGTTWKRIQKLSDLVGVVKVRINHIGEIVEVGEYD